MVPVSPDALTMNNKTLDLANPPRGAKMQIISHNRPGNNTVGLPDGYYLLNGHIQCPLKH